MAQFKPCVITILWVIGAAAALYVMGTSPARAVDLDQTIVFDIPAGPLPQALIDFSKQAHIQVLSSGDQIKQESTNGLSGTFTIRAGLTKLLKKSGLHFKPMGTDAIAIDTASGRASHRDEIRGAGSPSDSEPAASKNSANSDGGNSKDAIPEILVKGSRVLDMDIKRTVDDAQPYVVFDQATIQNSGVTNLEDFLKQRLPSNTAYFTNAQQGLSTGNLGNSSQINLRGLGTNNTLILIDGRRSASFDNGGIPQQPDINGIPLAAVDRIEVLPTTASGIYGGSATGGVINIILRRDYDGVEAKVNYDNVFSGDAPQRRVDVAAGFNLEGGRTNLLVAGSYSDQPEPLRFGDRNFLQKLTAAEFSYGGYAYFDQSGTPPLGATPNILSADGSNLVLKNGTPLNSPRSYVPVNYSGPASDGGTGLVANAGRYNLNLANTPQDGGGGGMPLQETPTIKSFSTTLRREFTPDVQAYLEGMASSNVAHLDANENSSVTLPASALSNPFQQAIIVSYPNNSVPLDQSFENDHLNLSGGVIVKLPRQWTAEADYNWDRSDYTYSIGPLDTVAAQNALNAGTINVLADTNVYPPNFGPFYGTYENYPTTRTVLTDTTLRLAGPVGSLPAGDISLSTAIEHRNEALSALYDATSDLFGLGPYSQFVPARSQSVNSVYLEGRLPIISAQNKVPGAELLELQVSGRWDEYTTHGANAIFNFPAEGVLPASQPYAATAGTLSSINPTIALRFQPVPDAMIRASYGTGFLPPTVDQLLPLPASPITGDTTPDPLRGNTPILSKYYEISGGNPNLKPEESKSWSAGLILTPRFVPGLRLSVDYTKIDKTRGITTPDLTTLLEFYPSLVVRGPPSASDIAKGWAGPIISVNETLLNVANSQVQAYDFQLDYHRETLAHGSFNFYALASLEPEYVEQFLPGSPATEYVGAGGGNPLKLKINAGLVWTYREWKLGWAARYFDSYDENSNRAVDPLLGTATIPSQIYHDVFAGYHFFPSSWGSSTGLKHLSGGEVTFGIKDLFNKEPPLIGNYPGYSGFGDPRMASYYLTLKISIQ